MALATAVCGAFLPLGRAASAPDWLQPFLSGDAVAWRPKEPVVTLLNHSDVHFLTPDRYTLQLRVALRANTDDGAKQLRIRLPYDSELCKITTVRAWIISPKGKVVPVSRHGFIDQSGYNDVRYWGHFRILTYDASAEIEPGSVLAWEFVYECPQPLGQRAWEVAPQHGLYRGEFEVFPSPNGQLSWHSTDPAAPSPQAGSEPGSLVWQMDKFKPMRAGLPDGFCAQPLAIRVRCQPQDLALPLPPKSEQWATLAATWSQFFAEKAVVGKEIQTIADAELGDKKTRWERIRALTQYVQKKITYLAVTEDKDVFAGNRPHPASMVAERKLGDCKDKATLLIALLRAAGEEGSPTLVFAGSPMSVDPDWPANDFNHVIVAFRSDADVPAWWPTAKGPDGSSYVLFDPTARTLPLGCLPPSDQGGYVLLLAPEHGGLMRITGDFTGVPPKRESVTVTLQPDGMAKISEVDELIGTEGAILQSTSESLSKDQFTRRLEQGVAQRGATASKLTWSVDWDLNSARFTLRTNFEVPQAARKIGTDQMLWIPPFKKAQLSLTPWETVYRGVAWLPRTALEEEIRVVLPEGMIAAELPSPIQVEHGRASAELSYTKEGSVVSCVLRFVRPAGLYSKTEYDKLHALGEKIATAQRRPIMLKSTAPAVAVVAP